MCINALIACMYGSHVNARCPEKLEECSGTLVYPGTRDIHLVSHHMIAGNRTYVLYKSSRCS